MIANKKTLSILLIIFLTFPLSNVFAEEAIPEETGPEENNEIFVEENNETVADETEETISEAPIPSETDTIETVSSGSECSNVYDAQMFYPDGKLAVNAVLQEPKECELEDDGLPPFDIDYLHGVTINEENSPFVLELMFDYPVDEDFSHFRIYRDGEMLESYYKMNSFIDTNVKPDTIYIYKIISVDVFGNHSLGFIQSIKTELIEDKKAPEAPTGLIVNSGNQSGRIVWQRNKEDDLSGYNVYVNGVRHNSELLKATNYYVSDLENDSMYSIAVTAVDAAGNESLYSVSESIIPIENPMPLFEMKNDFQSIAAGTNNWFTKLWPILAFAVGIPLAFYIGTRIKSLILN